MNIAIPFYSPEIWGGIECTINRVKDNFFNQLEHSHLEDREDEIEAIISLAEQKNYATPYCGKNIRRCAIKK